MNGAVLPPLSEWPMTRKIYNELRSVKLDKYGNVNPYVPGRTVCRDTFSFGGSGSSRYAWKLKVTACIDCVALCLLPDQTPVALTATLTVLSLVLSVPSTTSRRSPPC
jgi:hypothetical protein